MAQFALSKSAAKAATMDPSDDKREAERAKQSLLPEVRVPVEADRYHRVGLVPARLAPRRDAYIEAITGLWDQAQERFLDIGRYLITAKQDLPHGQFEAMVAADLPFGKSIAWQLRVIAEAVDQRRIQEDELPRSQKAAFKLVKLEDKVLTQARGQNLVRRDVTPREVDKFVGRLIAPTQTVLARQEFERATLKRRIEALVDELKVTKLRLAVLEGEMSSSVIEGTSEQT